MGSFGLEKVSEGEMEVPGLAKHVSLYLVAMACVLVITTPLEVKD